MPVLPSVADHRSMSTQPPCSTVMLLRPASSPDATLTSQSPAQKSNSRWAPSAHGDGRCAGAAEFVDAAGAGEVGVVDDACVNAATESSVAMNCTNDATRMFVS